MKLEYKPLTLLIISNELQQAKPQECWDLLFNKINSTMEDFKTQFENYIQNELQTAKDERKELLLVVNSELKSIVWKLKLVQMLNGNYKIFNEFLDVFQKKEYFGLEKKLLKIFQTTNEWNLFEKVLTNFRNIFDNSNSAKYTSRSSC